MAGALLVPELMSALVQIQGGTTGETQAQSIQKAFEYAPNSITPLPAFVNFYDGTEYVWPRESNGIREAVHKIRSLAVVSLQADSRDAERIARHLAGAFVDRLDQHKTLDDLVTSAEVIEAAVESIECGPVVLQPNEQPFVAASFAVRIRTFETVTYRSTGV